MRKRILSALLALVMVLAMLPGTALASVNDGKVDLKPTNELRWIDRVELPDHALTLYKALEEASDGDGYKDYLIDDEYYDLEGDNVQTDVPGEFMRGTVTSSNGSTTRYTAILVTTTEASKTDQDTKDYIANCIRTVVSAFKFDHQEVFWINGVYRINFDRNGTRYYCLALCADRSAPSEEDSSYYEIRRADFRSGGKWDIRSAMARRNADIEKILSTIPAGADRSMQIYYLNKWLAENNQYNTTVKKDGDGPWYAYECISALEGLGGPDGPVCSGYASAFKVLCDKLSIPCVTVTGRVTENTGHRWNYVQMGDGKWYAVDVTYDDRNDNSANLTKWLLVGSKTVVNGKEFLETHPAHNRSYYDGGTDFTNGPILSDEAFDRQKISFADVPSGAYYYDAVAWAVQNGITVGTSATTFDPDRICSQVQILTFLWRTAGEPSSTVRLPFTLGSGLNYAEKALCWAYEKGMIDASFDQTALCTRSITVKFIWQALGSPSASSSGRFSDVPSDAGYARAVNWAVSTGVTAGTSATTFSPGNTVTRKEAVTFLYRTYKK